ncbi:hypothetical protein OAH87_01625 [Marinomonas sp.]|nr:hypothetical protein [Marinomonas sp.]MDB4837145.1 hypothetical protein [Marinomonas sp.]
MFRLFKGSINPLFSTALLKLDNTSVGRWLKDVCRIFWELVKIMVPILVVVRVVELLGLITVLGEMISPIMLWVGLPGEMGLVWMTAMVSNLYAGMAIFYQLGGMEQLTVAQVSVLSSMMLLAHGLPVEAAIAKAVGVKVWFTLLLRIGGAMLFGMILHYSYGGLDLLQTPINAVWKPESQDSGWLGWFLLQGKTLIAAFVIIATLTLLIRILKFLGIEKLIHFLLSPLLRLLGIGVKASNIIVIGFTLGLSFGGSLLIREAKFGDIDSKDIFLTMAFLGICHSVIEDTLLMLLLGADLFSILWLRLVLGIVVIALLARFIHRLSDKAYARCYLSPMDKRSSE